MQNDEQNLNSLIKQFSKLKSSEYKKFREAMKGFKNELPSFINALNNLIEKVTKENRTFVNSRNNFLKTSQTSINPDITKTDITEMIIQYILSKDILTAIFETTDFYHLNPITFDLEKLIQTFFSENVKQNLFAKIQNYYEVIKKVALQIKDNRVKQSFLKIFYESFYKVYNPKGADTLGIVYTPNEIVRFMTESTDYLLAKHFEKELLSKNVKILDPATGIGTFITDLIDYFPSSKKKEVEYKYTNEIYANEVSILPYYIAKLNIAFAYQQKIEKYKAFENLRFIDTLDSIGFENSGYKKQNKDKISVIIGNPPYNANQQNENDNNKNPNYPHIDKRIKATYIKKSSAQKTKQYDMYKRFIRWSSDRIGEQGIISFVINRAFIDKRQDDGFRKSIEEEFDFCYIYDLGGDLRNQATKTNDNVFGMMIGVAILFLVKVKE